MSELDAGKDLDFSINQDRQVYFVQIEGSSDINGVTLSDGYALEVTKEASLNI